LQVTDDKQQLQLKVELPNPYRNYISEPMKHFIFSIFLTLSLLYQTVSKSNGIDLLLKIPFNRTAFEVDQYLISTNYIFKDFDSISYSHINDKSKVNSYYEYMFEIDSLFHPNDSLANFLAYYFEDKLYKVSYNLVGDYPENKNISFKVKELIQFMNTNYGKPKVRSEKGKPKYLYSKKVKVSTWESNNLLIILSEPSSKSELPEIVIMDKLNSTYYATHSQNNVVVETKIMQQIYEDADVFDRSNNGSGGVNERHVGEEIVDLDGGFNIDRENIHSLEISNILDTLFFTLIDRKNGFIIYKEDIFPIQGKYTISANEINSLIHSHVRGGWKQDPTCSTWENEYTCYLAIILQRKGKVTYEKKFTINPTIG
jgi:hypothetical protein